MMPMIDIARARQCRRQLAHRHVTRRDAIIYEDCRRLTTPKPAATGRRHSNGNNGTAAFDSASAAKIFRRFSFDFFDR